MTKKALITGITGQDGSYMADLLLSKGYDVYGLERRSSNKNRNNVLHIEDRLNFIHGDLTDQHSLQTALEIAQPDEVYNFAAISHVKVSFEMPETTADITGTGVLRLLEAIRKYGKPVRYYQASSSEMFGKVTETPQKEATRFYPRSPYAVAKLYAHWITKNYRESYGMYNVSGICYNHESERRGIEFVTRKITNGVAKIITGNADYIELGNLDAQRDWSYAPEIVKGIWMMLQQDNPDDYILASGKKYSIKQFLEEAFKSVGIENYMSYVKFNPKYLRPAEVDLLRGDASKAEKELGWKPEVGFKELVNIMVNHDVKIWENKK